jgi:2-methylcitrate dehydratase PrpD
VSAGLTQALARHAAETPFEAFPANAIEAAKRSLLDAVGVMIAASGLGEGCEAFAEEARAAGGTAEATVLGYGFRAPALSATLANGAMAHALDFEDAYDGAPLHPNAPTIPAALAVMEAGGAVSGKELLTALALGCDVVCRLGLGLKENPDVYGFYTPPILGAFGAAAAAGRLMRLTTEQMVDAFALTLGQATASAQFKTNPDSVVRAVRDAFAAHAGVLSARLAARGVKGFDGAFEGKYGLYALYARGACDADTVLRDLGKDFLGAYVSFKPWPACRGTHSFIEAALHLKATHKLAVADVKSVTAIGAPMMTMLTEPRAMKIAPRTGIDAKFSVPFTVATALIKDDVTLDDFSDSARGAPAVLRLAERTVFEVDPKAPPGMQAATRGTLRIERADRAIFEHTIDDPRGHPSNPLSNDDLQAKFRACALHAKVPASPETRERFIAEVAGLEKLGDASSLLRGL